MKIISLVILLCIVSFQANGQQNDEVIEALLEKMLETTESDFDYIELQEQLAFYLKHPIRINTCTYEDLVKCPMINELQATAIIAHRLKFGSFISVQELMVVAHMQTEQLKLMTFLFNVSTPLQEEVTIKNLRSSADQQVSSFVKIKSPSSKAMRSSPGLYASNSPYVNLRYKYTNANRSRFGFNIEKDAGETFIRQPGFLPDFVSGYFQLRDKGFIKNLCIGDFQANFGQGLTISTGLGFGKSSIITSVKSNNYGFDSYRSLREQAMLRGCAVSFNKNNWEWGGFISRKNIDGSTTDSKTVSSLSEDGGFHRTITEINKRGVIRDKQWLGYLQWRLRRLTIGLVHTSRSLSHSIIPKPQAYNLFYFRGQHYFKTGLYYKLNFRNIALFGESSYGSSFSHNIGGLIALSNEISLSILYRHYSSAFISYQSNGFGEFSSNRNETGCFVGFDYTISRRLKLMAYLDFFNSPWMLFQLNSQQKGIDHWIEIQYGSKKNNLIIYRFRSEEKLQQFNSEYISSIFLSRKNIHRIHLSIKATKELELRSRIELNAIYPTDTKGSLIYQEFIYKPKNSSWKIGLRIAHGQIETYDNRVYTFEQSIPSSYPLFNYSFSGSRFYVLVKSNITKKTSLYFKYGLDHHDYELNQRNNIVLIGSGNEEIIGPIKHNFALQVRVKL